MFLSLDLTTIPTIEMEISTKQILEKVHKTCPQCHKYCNRATVDGNKIAYVCLECMLLFPVPSIRKDGGIDGRAKRVQICIKGC